MRLSQLLLAISLTSIATAFPIKNTYQVQAQPSSESDIEDQPCPYDEDDDDIYGDNNGLSMNYYQQNIGNRYDPYYIFREPDPVFDSYNAFNDIEEEDGGGGVNGSNDKVSSTSGINGNRDIGVNDVDSGYEADGSNPISQAQSTTGLSKRSIAPRQTTRTNLFNSSSKTSTLKKRGNICGKAASTASRTGNMDLNIDTTTIGNTGNNLQGTSGTAEFPTTINSPSGYGVPSFGRYQSRASNGGAGGGGGGVLGEVDGVPTFGGRRMNFDSLTFGGSTLNPGSNGATNDLTSQ